MNIYLSILLATLPCECPWPSNYRGATFCNAKPTVTVSFWVNDQARAGLELAKGARVFEVGLLTCMEKRIRKGFWVTQYGDGRDREPCDFLVNEVLADQPKASTRKAKVTIQ